jgi:anti-sigma factor RsiW
MNDEPSDNKKMLTCQELVELVTAYHEGTLPQDERVRFDAHLAICPPCVGYVQQMQTVTLLVGQTASTETDAAATDELATRLFRAWQAANP